MSELGEEVNKRSSSRTYAIKISKHIRFDTITIRLPQVCAALSSRVLKGGCRGEILFSELYYEERCSMFAFLMGTAEIVERDVRFESFTKF